MSSKLLLAIKIIAHHHYSTELFLSVYFFALLAVLDEVDDGVDLNDDDDGPMAPCERRKNELLPPPPSSNVQWKKLAQRSAYRSFCGIAAKTRPYTCPQQKKQRQSKRLKCTLYRHIPDLP